MKCTNCGQEVDSSALSCPHCNTPIVKKTVNDMLVEQIQNNNNNHNGKPNSHNKKQIDYTDELQLYSNAKTVYAFAFVLLVVGIIFPLIVIVMDDESWPLALSFFAFCIVGFVLLLALSSRMKVLAHISKNLKHLNAKQQ